MKLANSSAALRALAGRYRRALTRRRRSRRRYASTRAVVAFIVLVSFATPGIAAVIGAVVAGW